MKMNIFIYINTIFNKNNYKNLKVNMINKRIIIMI